MARPNKSSPSRIIVIGTSAGGMEALKHLVIQFPASFPAPIFIVNHLAPETRSDVLVRSLDAMSSLPCIQPEDGQTFKNGHIYVAPSDHHMLIAKNKILITKGARENRYRPAIDPLFRSAAVAYGNRVIGIVLTGHLDDGTSGLTAIKKCGGTTVVQDPSDAAYPSMPTSALQNLKVDHCVPLAEIGELLSRLIQKKLRAKKAIPTDVAIEAKIAQRVLSDLPSVEALGEQVPFNCPDCGGVLWKMSKGKLLRYRCHTGHAFTSAALLAAQTAKVEETLWVALRMFEERKNLLVTMSQEKSHSPSVVQRAKESQVHIERIRAMLKSSDEASQLQ